MHYVLEREGSQSIKANVNRMQKHFCNSDVGSHVPDVAKVPSPFSV